ncbi:MAG: DNA recombination protein RmuC [alpha proteobacterium HIMB59]|nr:MAG: DNA recombination protein RmuC [alpha proteobacterium HIMB59]|tara:strand:- start:1664 stop:2626 length:963 start_codon:yes stop_codon:yes gene_type:complete
MNLEYFIILLLCIVIILLTIVILNSNKKEKSAKDIDLTQINFKIESLFNKTLEQSGYVNSKIDEIGRLTKKMTNAMTTNISDMGQMGEVILENILQDCGMTKDRDYKTQYTDKNDEGQQFRPDVVIFLPENRNIIIDSKVPLKDWYEFQNTDDNQEKELHIKNFINSLKNHISSINKKDYTKLLNINSPEYVFIFMPHEFSLITAQKYDNTLLTFAQQKQIIIVGPTTLIMCMKLVESIWKLEKQNKNSKEIAEIAGGMFDQIAKSINLLDKTESSIQKSLESITQSKNYIKEGRGSLFSKANKMRELGANTKTKIDSFE